MGLAHKVAQRLDQSLPRSMIARLASIPYFIKSGGKQRFSVDADDRWINHQPDATIVSTAMHTGHFPAVRAWVLDNFTFGYRPKPGDTVIDVGAGLGEDTVVFSHLVGKEGRVISIEAHPATFACLQETIRRSGLKNVTALNVALTDRDGPVTIADSDNHLTSSIMSGDGSIEIPGRSLDSLAAELGIDRIALVKMNIEGAERDAVAGMAGLAGRTDNVVISCHDFRADRGDGEEYRSREVVRPLLERYGFALTTRPDDPAPWVRDYFYGHRPAPSRAA